MPGEKLQAGERREQRPGPLAGALARSQLLDRQKDPRDQTEGVRHRKQQEAHQAARKGIDHRRHRRAGAADAELARQEVSPYRADRDAKPWQKNEPELERQQGEEQVQREERRTLTVAPEGSTGRLVRIPQRQAACAQLAAQKEQPGLDLKGDVAELGIADDPERRRGGA